MKKTISYALIFSFVFALAVQIPALAEDTATTTPEPMLTSTNSGSVEATSTSAGIPSSWLRDGASSTTPRVEPQRPEPVRSSSTTAIGKNLERIPAPEYVKYFEKIQQIGKDLFGIRKNEQAINKIKQEAGQTIKATNTSSTTLEKIPAPEHMSLFEKITKIGNDLFGIKKQDGAKASSTPKINTNNLEKITSLDQVKLFDQIKKIGNDLFGVKKPGAYTLPTMTADLITCTSAAIDVKDTTIGTAFTNSATEIATAMTTRGTCQKAALAMTTERQGALNTCNKAFQAAHKTATDKAKNAQKEAWTTYSNSLKACATAAGTTEIKIEDGGQNVNDALQQ